jgi:hypothetical protein
MLEILQINLLSPLCLAFALGVVARVVHSELTLPRDLYASLSIYLLLAIGLKGGVELSHSEFSAIIWPALATLTLGCLTPVTSFLTLRKLGGFSISDAAGIAAHYGSVSAVTFIAAQQFVTMMQAPAEGFMPTLLTVLEIPGIYIALAIGAILLARDPAAEDPLRVTDVPQRPLKEVVHEVLTARSMMLLVGGLVIGCLVGTKGYEPVKPFFEGMFKGALTLFLLDMGLSAGSRLGDLRQAGAFLLGFGMIMPLIHGTLGAVLGAWSGLSLGGTTVLATMAASASYIAAPPAVRMTLPKANPTYYLTAALAITFPFNLLAGIPVYFYVSKVMIGYFGGTAA